MSKRAKYLYHCPDCHGESWLLGNGGQPGKFLETHSLVDGRSYPSCRRIERLCYWCIVAKWGDKENELLPLPRKSAGAALSQSSTSRPLDAGLLKQYVELWAFLTSATFEDGTTRKTGSLSLSFGSGLLGLSMNDAETGQYAFLQGRSLDDLLLEAEGRLADGSTPWKVSKWMTRKK